MFVKIIDKNGKKIGCIDKRYLAPLELRHQIVRVLIYDTTTKKILLQQRSLKDDSCPGQWDSSASGHVESDESLIEAVLRELEEEIGIKTTENNLEEIGNYDTLDLIENGKIDRQNFVYLMKVDAPPILKLEPEEVETVGWYSFKELSSKNNEFKITPGASKALQILQRFCSDN